MTDAYSTPRVVALANQKGGVGKTTTAINLGTALAAVGENVLIVDLDPQGNASTGLGVYEQDRTISTYDVLTGRAELARAVMATGIPNLSVAPSTLDLLGLEREILSASDRAFRLRKAIGRLAAEPPVDGNRPFSYIMVDCPPSLNILTINALAAANAVLVPVQCEYFAMQGIVQLKKTIDEVKGALNPELEIQGIVLTMFDKRNNLANEVVREVSKFFGEKVYTTVIPRNVRVAEAPSYGRPVLLYDYNCAGSQAYIQLASEMIDRQRRQAVA